MLSNVQLRFSRSPTAGLAINYCTVECMSFGPHVNALCDTALQESTCIAFDLMSANLADLPELPKLLPALQMLFKDEIEQAEE